MFRTYVTTSEDNEVTCFFFVLVFHHDGFLQLVAGRGIQRAGYHLLVRANIIGKR